MYIKYKYIYPIIKIIENIHRKIFVKSDELNYTQSQS